jgi:Icc-related predicted phosphoesterase
MRIVCLSDTHNRHEEIAVPDGDVLIHAGDLTNTGSAEEIVAALSWLAKLPHRYKIVIAGNHDWLFDSSPTLAASLIPSGVCYLQDSGCSIEGIHFWGSPVQPWFLDWAFNRRSEDIARHWAMIPAMTDVLVTHGPPKGKRDFNGIEHSGCEMLLRRLSEVRPKLHVYGHIHGGYGVDVLGPTLSVNAAICDDSYRPVNLPITVNMDGTTHPKVT